MAMLFVLAGCSAGSKNSAATKQTELTISAAASLQDALNEIKPAFEKEHPDIKVNYNFGGSGTLQQQISQGAPADLFFSAAQDKYDVLAKKGLIQKGTELLGNDLVLAVPKNAAEGISSFPEITKAKRIALGTPESVPAGKYAKESLEKMKLWKPLEGKTVFGKDVRQVLSYIETGNADAGLVYRTDALSSDKIKIIAAADEKTHSPIIYPAGVLKNTKHKEEAELFYSYLQKEQAMKIFKKYGFKDLAS
ncbi:molybdate ABC transporter substrate-binding protein [Metabacillus sp. GX 13764]|uniref:molybdate ABC transporter substrate-binding protein n=1 Tax=Metabacillus kandeliae TaxID=2900151 RepID=UPI001E3E5A92|nr:molybdate ABC transporter substrate-binding protein [Metabacillus kandeliae]MCD7035681.1 molybdate ABC transporter substrate-binding protein [Metabacillus kandeliae]